MHLRQQFRGVLLGFAGFFLFLGEASLARAEPLLTITNTTSDYLDNPPFTLGFNFTAQTSSTATALGLFDDSQNGLAENHSIGLWDSNGNLLALATVDAGTADPLIDQFRYVSISPVNLTAGQTYEVGAFYTSGADPVLFPGQATGFAVSPLATFGGAFFAGGSTLAEPINSFGGGAGFFGPNVLLSVPEPTSAALLGLGVFAWVGARRWKAKRRTP